MLDVLVLCLKGKMGVDFESAEKGRDIGLLGCICSDVEKGSSKHSSCQKLAHTALSKVSLPAHSVAASAVVNGLGIKVVVVLSLPKFLLADGGRRVFGYKPRKQDQSRNKRSTRLRVVPRGSLEAKLSELGAFDR